MAGFLIDWHELIRENYRENIPTPDSLDIGDSSTGREGQGVLVIGNPEGLEGTVTDGINSAFRDDSAIIQITAPISPGSSGSPVLNESGKVIAIATYFAREGQNLNFAVSANVLAHMITNYRLHDDYKLDASAVKEARLSKCESLLNKAYADLLNLKEDEKSVAYEPFGANQTWLSWVSHGLGRRWSLV